MRMRKRMAGFVLSLVMIVSTWVQADIVCVLSDNSHSSVNNAINQLSGLGHSVFTSSVGLTDYSSFDQVWDLRYATELVPVERTAFATYLASGGNLYLSGENGVFDERNNAINTFLNEIGAGQVGLVGNTVGWEDQIITAAGQSLGLPNSFDDLTTYYARRVTAPSSGFLMIESSVSGTGSLVGWDFGDLPNHVNSRLMIGYDIELFDNGPEWTENVASFGGATPVPEPSSLALVSTLMAFSLMRRRKP